MKLTVKIKLLPTDEQGKSLLKTMEQFNTACNYISDKSFFERRFNHIKLHHVVYYSVREIYGLPAQFTVRAIGKVCESYKLNRTKQKEFKIRGAIAYDSRLLTYGKETVSICTLNGREKIPFVCNRSDWMPHIKGEGDLVFRKGKFFLLQTIEFPQDEVKECVDFIGVDMGLVDMATLSDGTKVSSKWINEYKIKRGRIRSSIQSKGTKGAKKLLKRLSGMERTTAHLINHTLSKQIVIQAISQNKGVAVEDLTHIRKNIKWRVGKNQMRLRSQWSFKQLRNFIQYKCAMSGVPFTLIPPAYTSKMCSCCNHIGLRNRKSFVCKNCGLVEDADVNAAINIATWGRIINRPESSTLHCGVWAK